MRNLKRNLLAIGTVTVLASAISGCFLDQKTGDDYYRKLAQKMVKKMSDAEMLNMVVGTGYETKAVNLSDDVSGVAGYIDGVSSDLLDIPATKLADGPAGVRIAPTREGDSATYYATAWPVGTLLASSWDIALVKAVGEAYGNEAKEYGVDFALAPGMNIQRNPLGGRNFEYYSEDPLLSGKIGAAMVEGIQKEGVGATIKHFVANNQETERMKSNNVVTPRALREIYLRSFQIAVEEAQPWALMTSYNLINGIYSNERYDGMTSVLRGEWGFKGLVMSDWFAGNVSTTPYKQLLGGQDLIEPGGSSVLQSLQDSIDHGDLSMDTVKEHAVNILTQVLKTPSYQRYAYASHPDLNAHAKLSRRAATESMVLLKNDATHTNGTPLPISQHAKVAVFGVNQINTYKGGTGSGDVNASHIVTIEQGLANRFNTDTAISDFYDTYFDENKVSTPGLFGGADVVSCDEAPLDASVSSGSDTLTDLIADAAQNDDVAVVTIGRLAGEGADRSQDADYYFTDAEIQLIQTVKAHFGTKPVVVVLNVTGTVDTEQWKDSADGILLAYLGGQEVGDAVADVLSGDVNPSGKLAQSFPVSYDVIPSAESEVTFPGTDDDGDGVYTVNYNDGIYVGYRYFNSDDDYSDVSYPFGYGLSYTSFHYSDVKMIENTYNQKGRIGQLRLQANITNTGPVAGKEVVEVYVHAPEVKLDKPTYELKAFAKTDILAPGKTQTLSFTIPANLLASFDQADNEWIIEPGNYTVYVSPSSDVTAANQVHFRINQEIVVSHTTPEAYALERGVASPETIHLP